MKVVLIALTVTIASALYAEDSKPINPALLYWQAASELPQLTDDQAKELTFVANGMSPFDAAKDKELLKSELTFRMLRKATDSSATCDWGLATEDGPGMILPHVSKMREMSNLAILRAEALFADGKVKEGTDWLLISHRMARHVGAGDLLVSYLIQEIMEIATIRAAGRHCLTWDAPTRHDYAAALKALPPLHSAQAAFNGELIFIDWVERHTAADGRPDTQLQAAITIAETNKLADKEALATLHVTKAAIAAWRDLQSRVDTAFGKAWPQAQPELETLTAEAANSPHLLVRIAFPTTTKVVEHGFTTDTLRTMLEAALQHGDQLDEATASTYHDSFNGEPLRLQKAANGALTLVAAPHRPAGTDLTLELGK